MTAVLLSRRLGEERRPATSQEQQLLARWSSWGALADLFDEAKPEWSAERARLRELFDEDAWRAAERTTINAHYTDPAYAGHIWGALQRLGFEGGRVLEPGSGSGTFIGLAPPGAQMVGVELDPVTAAVSRGLYPAAEIRTESFADTRMREGSFDAAVGNVPFADVVLHDPVHNTSRLSMHNHFIVKTLHLVRPGGVLAMLTSHWTMDAENPAARREIGELADLVGAVRLPTGAHRRAAGTEAITDLLVLRRRVPGAEPRTAGWDTVTPVTIDGRTIRINDYFATYRPDHVLGEMSIGQGMYNAETLRVTADLETVADRLGEALSDLTGSAAQRGLTFQPASEPVVRARAAAVPADPGLFDGSIRAQADGSFRVVADRDLVPLKVPRSASMELRALLRLRDGATLLLEREAATREDTPEVDGTRADLRAQYRAYVARYGPLNRYTLRPTGRRDAETGEEKFARTVPTPLRLLRADPFGPLVMALELFDEQEQTATPAGILRHRVVSAATEVRGVETAADAISVSLDRTGRIDAPLIAELLGVGLEEAHALMAGHVFREPDTDALVHAPEYLSGNVRVKLDQAEAAVREHPEFQENVDALRNVLPEPLGTDEIAARLGAVWISAEVHRQFLEELLRAEDVRVENPLPGMWEVRGGRQGVLSLNEWGTQRRPAPDLAQSVMEQKRIQVYDEYKDPDGTVTRVFNAVETTAAQEKADALQERFGEWVWEDPERARQLAEVYNRKFNSIVLRDYSSAGEYLTFPGMAKTFTLRPHQRAAVARMVAEPAVGLFHEVGAGKTAEMVAGAMELRRMGLVRKPMIVVPNHMLEQFSREWLQIYPRAKILAASSSDLAADRRRLFVARAAANDWDGVILTQGAFARIGVDRDTERRYLERQTDFMRAALAAAAGEDRMSVKRIQKRLLQLENKQKELLDQPRDPGITFEATGVDYLIVDELHMFKNLSTESNIQDAAVAGSERASDLHMKLESLRQRGRDRVVAGATATPIANSITEAYIMQRYLRPDLLDDAGLGHFDAWAATFGQTVTEMEMSPTGSSFRLKTRFARFQNVPEMLRMWSTFADVKTAEDLKLPVPEIAARDDGTRAARTVRVAPTPELERYVEAIAERAENIAAKKVTPDVDNMLKVSTDGRKAALDVRLVLSDAPSGQTKVDVAADLIHSVWEENRNREYDDPATDEVSPIRGALQLVFSDLGTPGKNWSVYAELRDQLHARGLPAGSVRFIHEAANDGEKARLFAAARAGHVAVLVGSTGKMGVGTNVQARAIALHHLDCPWRPADIAQREGRIVRQGNQNPEVVLTRLVTEGSFDSYMWQAVERKAKFIGQIMRGTLDVREIEEIDSAALSAAEAKAIASGNPLLLERSVAQNELTRLQRLERAHIRNQSMLHHTRDRAAEVIGHGEDAVAALSAALPRIRDTSGDRFRMTITDRSYDTRTGAAEAIAYWARNQNVQYLPQYGERELGRLGEVSGFTIHARGVGANGKAHVEFRLEELPRTRIVATREETLAPGVGLVQRLENRVSQLPSIIQKITEEIDGERVTLADAEHRLGQPFKHAGALTAAEQRLRSVDAELAALTEPVDAPAPTGLDGGTPTTPGSSLDREHVRQFRPALGVAGTAGSHAAAPVPVRSRPASAESATPEAPGI